MKNLKLIGGLGVVALMGFSNVYAKDCTELQTKINNATSGTTVEAESCDGNLVFDRNKDLIFDLHGSTINTSDIKIEGNVTIKDSLGNAKIIGTTTGTKAAIAVKGNMILESGQIEANSFAIMADGGSVTVNGGSVKARYAALSGNNTYGSMTFNVNGGTLSSNEGPAVYMPGPISYTMTDGNIVGGLLFRMGEIKISGGKISAQTDKNVLDDLKQYYNYNGYVNYPDALGVIAGTYTTNIEGQTNKLNLEITGGEFTSTHGSAVAIYDFGKVAQDKKVTISNGTFKTTETSRKSYEIITLGDLGITNHASGYNNQALMGNTKTTIIGGTYSSDVTSFLNDNYVQTNGVVSKKQTTPPDTPDTPEKDNDIKINAPTIGSQDEVKELTGFLENVESAKEAFINAIKKLNIKTDEVYVDVKMTNVKEEEITDSVLTNIKETLKNSYPTAQIAGYFDISLNVLDNNTSNHLKELKELDQSVEFSIALPKEFKEVDPGYTRTYYIIRYHNDEAEIINANLNKDKTSVSFKTDKFSTYALAYRDTKEEIDVPKTVDSIVTYLLTGALTILSIIGLTKYLKKHN